MNFQDTYKKKYSGAIKKFSASEIIDNPILTMVHGASEDEVRRTLRSADWTDQEIDYIIAAFHQAKAG